jgi:hypothetical protein
VRRVYVKRKRGHLEKSSRRYYSNDRRSVKITCQSQPVGIRVASRKLIGKVVNGDHGTWNFGCKNPYEECLEKVI